MKFKEAKETDTLPRSEARDLIEEFEASGLRCAVVDWEDTYSSVKQARACIYGAAQRYGKSTSVKQREKDIYLINEEVEEDVF